MAFLNIVIYTTLIVVTSLGTVQVSNKNHYFILQISVPTYTFNIIIYYHLIQKTCNLVVYA